MTCVKEDKMDNQQLRRLKDELGIMNYKINYKTGVHLGVIEDFFAGRTETLAPEDRRKIETLLEWERRKR